MTKYIIRYGDDRSDIEIADMSVFAVNHLSKVVNEYKVLSNWLDTLGDMAEGETLMQRVQSVVRHYATQVGRMAGDDTSTTP